MEPQFFSRRPHAVPNDEWPGAQAPLVHRGPRHLGGTRHYSRVDGGSYGLGIGPGADVLASSPEGGGTRSTTFEVSLPDTNLHMVDLVIRAVDLSNQEGADYGLSTRTLQAGAGGGEQTFMRPRRGVRVMGRL